MDQSVKVVGTEGKVGGCFCRLLPFNENAGYTLELSHPYPSNEHKHCCYREEQYFVLVRSVSS